MKITACTRLLGVAVALAFAAPWEAPRQHGNGPAADHAALAPAAVDGLYRPGFSAMSHTASWQAVFAAAR